MKIWIKIQRDVMNIGKKLFNNWQNKCKEKKENKEEKWVKIGKESWWMKQTNNNKKKIEKFLERFLKKIEPANFASCLLGILKSKDFLKCLSSQLPYI